jgi:hypothetical protein
VIVSPTGWSRSRARSMNSGRSWDRRTTRDEHNARETRLPDRPESRGMPKVPSYEQPTRRRPTQ